MIFVAHWGESKIDSVPESAFIAWDDFKDDNANIGAVIGLKREIIIAKKDFEKFTQKIASYVATNVTMGT